jgi:uncharacterized protein YbdZ (MbtH family)
MEVKLPCGAITVIDECDSYLIELFPNWRKHKFGHVLMTRYIKTEFGSVRQDVYLHRAILKPHGYFITDHIDRNPLNNKRSNLRYANHSENAVNRGKTKNKTSKYFGVCRSKKAKSNVWRVYLRHPKGHRIVKCFAEEKDAALFYNDMAKEIWGEFAPQNIIE